MSGAGSKADRGRELILRLLADGGWHPTAEVYAALASEGIAGREARRLAGDLGVERRLVGYPPRGIWRSPSIATSVLPVAVHTLAELRERLEVRAGARTTGTRAAAGRVVHAVVEAERAGDDEALRDALIDVSAEFLLWAERIVPARRAA